MKNIVRILLCMELAGQVLGANVRLETTPDSTLWLVGDSTLHPFTSRATLLQASGTLGATSFDAILHQGALKTFDVVIPVTSLKSKDAALDKNMYKALKAESCPNVSFHLISYEVVPSTGSPSGQYATASGTLSIACQEQPVTLEMKLAADPQTLHVQGDYTLLMTDYGVKPPTMMLGTIKVKNPVVIHFDLQLTSSR
jgi:polyisoprenoid-binding protein YceI